MIRSNKDDTYQVTIEQHRVDGFTVELSEWTGEDWQVHWETRARRYIGYTYFEAVCDILMKSGVPEEHVFGIAEEMGFAWDEIFEEED